MMYFFLFHKSIVTIVEDDINNLGLNFGTQFQCISSLWQLVSLQVCPNVQQLESGPAAAVVPHFIH